MINPRKRPAVRDLSSGSGQACPTFQRRDSDPCLSNCHHSVSKGGSPIELSGSTSIAPQPNAPRRQTMNSSPPSGPALSEANCDGDGRSRGGDPRAARQAADNQGRRGTRLADLDESAISDLVQATLDFLRSRPASPSPIEGWSTVTAMQAGVMPWWTGPSWRAEPRPGDQATASVPSGRLRLPRMTSSA